jgi:hypothetical protein
MNPRASSPVSSPVSSSAKETIVATLRSRLGPESRHALYGMHVDDVRSADHGDGTLIEVRFRHSARPDASFVVRFPLIDLEIDRPDEEYDEDTLEGGPIGVIWANMLEISALPNDYLPRRASHGEVEVFAY